MNVQECFEILGADYEDALDRLMTEKRITKYTIRFLNEPTFSKLKESMEREDYDEAFKAAHSFKGLCQNISFSQLFKPAYELTENLREGKRDINQAKIIFAEVEKIYNRTIETISLVEGEI